VIRSICLLCILMVFSFGSVPAAAVSFGTPAQEEEAEQLPEDEVVEEEIAEGEVIEEGENEEQDGTDLPETEEGEVLPDESGDSAAPEEAPLEGTESTQPSDGTVPEKVDPFTESGLLDDYAAAVVDDYGADLLSIPATTPIGGYYTSVTSSIGSGDLFLPVEFSKDYLTFDSTGKMVCLANSTVNALLVTDYQVIQVRFPAMSYPQYYTQSGTNYYNWVDFDITSAQDGNISVMQQFDFAWISDNLYQACILLIGGILVCKVFMSKS